MSGGKKISKLYRRICQAADLEEAVRRAADKDLRELRGALARRGNLSGVPGLVWGVVTVECADRFMLDKTLNAGGRDD